MNFLEKKRENRGRINQEQPAGKTWIIWIFCLAGAALSCMILNSRQFLAVPVFGELYSVQTAVLFLLSAYFYRWGLWGIPRRRLLFSLLPGFLMSLMTLLGLTYSENTTLVLSWRKYIVGFLAVWLLFTAASAFGLRLLDRGTYEEQPSERRKKAGADSRKRTFGFWLFLMLLTGCIYIPVFLAVYPGIYSYDASVQILQCLGELPLTTHHPLLHTAFLYGCLKAGALLFGSCQAGMAIHSVLQSAFVGAVFSFVLCRMRRRGAPAWLLALSWLFLVVNPYLAVFSFVTTKDVLFGAFFLLVFDSAFDMTVHSETFWSDKKRFLFFGTCALLMCLFRNQGIYVFWFFMFFALISFAGKTEKKTAVKGISFAVLAVTVVWYVLSGPLPSLFGVEKGDVREMMSVPMQQLARAYHEEPTQLLPEEITYIETVIDPAALDAYVRVNADPVKAGFRTEVLKEDPGKFFRIWRDIGLRLPELYLDSFFMGNWGYWYPGASQYWISYILFDGAFMEPEYNRLGITRGSHFPQLEAWLRSVTLTPAFESVPILRTVLNQAFPFWLMLFTAASVLYRKQKGRFLPLLLIFGYWGTLLLGPVTGLRYAIPLVYCVPVMLEQLVQSSASFVPVHEVAVPRGVQVRFRP